MSTPVDDGAPVPRPAAVTVVPFPVPPQRQRWWGLGRHKPVVNPVVPPPAPPFLPDLDDTDDLDDLDLPYGPDDLEDPDGQDASADPAPEPGRAAAPGDELPDGPAGSPRGTAAREDAAATRPDGATAVSRTDGAGVPGPRGASLGRSLTGAALTAGSRAGSSLSGRPLRSPADSPTPAPLGGTAPVAPRATPVGVTPAEALAAGTAPVVHAAVGPYARPGSTPPPDRPPAGRPSPAPGGVARASKPSNGTPPTSKTPTSQAPTGQAPTGQAPTSQPPTSQAPTSQPPTSQPPTSQPPTGQTPTSQASAPGAPLALPARAGSATVEQLIAASLPHGGATSPATGARTLPGSTWTVARSEVTPGDQGPGRPAEGEADPAVQAIRLLVSELAATRQVLTELVTGHRSETVALREEVAELRQEVRRAPQPSLLGVTRAILQATNDELAARALRLGTAASDAFAASAEEVGLDPAGLVALQEWVLVGGQGVVVAPDDQQRLLLGVAAVHQLVGRGRSCVVVAPRRQDVAVWADALRTHLPGTTVLTNTARSHGDLAHAPLLVTTARAFLREEVGHGPAAELLVAVDAERFGAPSLATALDERCAWRLGLSARYRRTDDGLVHLTDPYFSGGVVHAG